MRLQAAISLLHLSTIKTFATAISTKFLRLACVTQVRILEHIVHRFLIVATQDSCFEVRQLFLSKLLTLLQPRKLPPYFNVIPFLTVIDPESEIKNMVSLLVRWLR